MKWKEKGKGERNRRSEARVRLRRGKFIETLIETNWEKKKRNERRRDPYVHSLFPLAWEIFSLSASQIESPISKLRYFLHPNFLRFSCCFFFFFAEKIKSIFSVSISSSWNCSSARGDFRGVNSWLLVYWEFWLIFVKMKRKRFYICVVTVGFSLSSKFNFFCLLMWKLIFFSFFFSV